MALPPIPMNTFDVMEADPRWRNSTVSAFYAAKPKRARAVDAVEWVVCVKTGAIVDHHRFATREKALAFAKLVEPGFAPKEGV